MSEPIPPAAALGDPGEEAAWALLRARWEDPIAHRTFLERCVDLPALGRAGARYREALLADPHDPIAAAGRDEVLRRAALLGLAASPRHGLPARSSPWVKWILVVAIGLALGLTAWMALTILRPGWGR